MFLARNCAVYNPPSNAPAAYPNIPAGAGLGVRKELRAINKLAAYYWNLYHHTQRIVVNIGAASFEMWVIAEDDDPNEGLNGVTVRQLYDHVTSRFVKIS